MLCNALDLAEDFGVGRSALPPFRNARPPFKRADDATYRLLKMKLPPAPVSEAHPAVRFSSADFASPKEAYERFCDLGRMISDVTHLGELSEFHISTTTFQLDNAVLVEARSCALRYTRTPAHVAYGVDHYQVVLYLGGGGEFFADDTVTQQRAGDISVINLARPFVVREIQAKDGATSSLNVLLPRLLLAPALADRSAGATISLLSRETPYGRMVGEFLLSLRRSAAELSRSERQAMVQSLAVLIAGGFGSTGFDTRAAAMKDDLLARVKLHIEHSLSMPSLDVENLCAGFGLSRASLYRLFAPNSPANYIQERRLHRAFAMLLSPAFRSWRIIDIACDCCFSSDATFIRAFRRQFGLSPGEARKLGEQRPRRGVLGADENVPQPDEEALRWVFDLTGTMPPSPALSSETVDHGVVGAD
jgi:AraC-like DNA-binding protein